jgi:hypothetical protein
MSLAASSSFSHLVTLTRSLDCVRSARHIASCIKTECRHAGAGISIRQQTLPDFNPIITAPIIFLSKFMRSEQMGKPEPRNHTKEHETKSMNFVCFASYGFVCFVVHFFPVFNPVRSDLANRDFTHRKQSSYQHREERVVSDSKKERRSSLIKRREFLGAGLAAGVAAATLANPALSRTKKVSALMNLTTAAKSFELEEATIADLQEGMRAGKYTAREIAEKYLERIEKFDRKGPCLKLDHRTQPRRARHRRCARPRT